MAADNVEVRPGKPGRGDAPAGTRAEKLAELEGIRELEVDPETARPRLEELLGDPDEEVRAEAAGAVWNYYDVPEIVEKTLALAVDDKARAVRVKATSALGRVIYEGDIAGADLDGYEPDEALGEPPAELWRRVRARLVATASDPARSLDERRFALEGLGFVGTAADVRALIEKFHAMSEPTAKLSAIFAMGRSGDARFAPQIVGALDETRDQLALQAIWAAGEAELAQALPRLARFALDGKTDQRKAAVEALGRIGGNEAAKSLLKVADSDSDPEVRQAATIALEEVAMGHGADAEKGDSDSSE